MLLIWTVMLNVVSDSIVALAWRGKVMIDETIFVFAGISPIAVDVSGGCDHALGYILMPLQEPVVICRPLVNVFPAQLLMKLAGSV